MIHQNDAINFQFENDIEHAAFLMEMRLGKTLAVIRWLRKLTRSENHPNQARIVMAPLTVCEAWERELTLEGELYEVLYSKSAAERQRAIEWAMAPGPYPKWIIANYDTVRNSPDIANFPWYAAIADESTRVRNPRAQITKICCGDYIKVRETKTRPERRFQTRGFSLTKHRVVLTGLIAPENLLDVFSQFKFLHGSFLGYTDFWKFRAALFEQGYDGYSWLPKPGVYRRIQNEMHRLSFVLRRADVGIGSRAIYQKRIVPMTPAQKRIYKQLENEYAYELNGVTNETNYSIVNHMWCSLVAGGFTPERELLSTYKADEIIELARGELQGQKIVVWFRFRHELEYVAQRLNKAGLRSLIIIGGTTQAERGDRLRRFRADEEITFMLAMEKCAQFGVDASVSDVAIYYSNEWSCEIRAQSKDRIVHPQKTRPLLYIDLITRGTIDEDVTEVVTDKTISAQSFMVRVSQLLNTRRLRDNAGRNNIRRS